MLWYRCPASGLEWQQERHDEDILAGRNVETRLFSRIVFLLLNSLVYVEQFGSLQNCMFYSLPTGLFSSCFSKSPRLPCVKVSSLSAAVCSFFSKFPIPLRPDYSCFLTCPTFLESSALFRRVCSCQDCPFPFVPHKISLLSDFPVFLEQLVRSCFANLLRSQNLHTRASKFLSLPSAKFSSLSRAACYVYYNYYSIYYTTVP